MLPSTSSWSSHYGSNFPASSSLTNFGERNNHRMAAMMMSNQSPSSHWGGGGGGHVVHRPHHETGFVPPPVDLRYQQATDAWMSSSSSASPRGSSAAGGFAVKDDLSDASEYSSSEDTCSDYRDALGGGGGGGGQDYRGGELGDRSRKTTADRRADISESMTAEEVEKRRVRRERNKMAAARCRQRRVDLTNQLLAETETLEDERDSLQKEIQALQRQRSQLEDLLGSHAPQCKSRALIGGGPGGPGGPGGGGHTIDIPPIKTEKCDDYFNIADTGLRRASCNSYSLPSTTFQSCSRPDSLPLTRRPKLLIAAGGGGSAGPVSNLGLDCMLDGHTGLTPITGAPSGPEGIVRSPPVECGGYSPTTLMTL